MFHIGIIEHYSMSKSFFVYKIICKENNKIYIGKSTDPKRRWWQHIYTSKSVKNGYKQLLIHKAIKKYGQENFDFSILNEYDNENDAFISEKFYIGFYKSNDRNYGYNLTDGGEGMSGFRLTEEQKHNISIKNSGENNGMYGKAASQETRLKLSNSSKNKIGKPHTDEMKKFYKENIKNIDLSKIIPDEIKSKIVDMYNKCKHTKKQISEITGVKYHTVCWIVRRKDMPRYPNLIPEDVRNKVLQLKQNGISIKETAIILDIPVVRVETIRRKPRFKSIKLH